MDRQKYTLTASPEQFARLGQTFSAHLPDERGVYVFAASKPSHVLELTPDEASGFAQDGYKVSGEKEKQEKAKPRGGPEPFVAHKKVTEEL